MLDPPTQARSGQPKPVRRLSFAAAYDLWHGSWEAALAALATATQNGTFSPSEAAAHKALIAAERDAVTEEMTLLLEFIRRPA